MKILRKAIRNIILEIWSFSDDFSNYGKKYISLDGTNTYPDSGIENTKTHGFYSHAIKHAEEFDINVVNSCFENIKNYIMAPDIKKDKHQYTKKDRTLKPLTKLTPKQWHKAIQSVLDNINDTKILGNATLSAEQEKIWAMAQPIWELYTSIEDQIKTAPFIDVSDQEFQTPEQLRVFLKSKMGSGAVLYWIGRSPTKTFEVKFRPDDTTYMSYNGEEIYTLMKINKTERRQNMVAGLASQAKTKGRAIANYTPSAAYSNFSTLCQDVYDTGTL